MGWILLKDSDTYQASLPVRELRPGSLLMLYQLPFYARITTDLNSFAERMSSELGMHTSVDYITAASHSGKSASVLVGFLRSRELGSAQLNFTHYLYMPFANNSGNYHRRVSEAKLQRACGQDDELRTGLGAAYMRDCFRAQTFDSDYVDEWHLPNATQPRRSCLRRTFPPSCNAVPRACFWCTWMSRGLCVQTQTSGEVPWEYLQSFLVSRSWQRTLTFHPCPSRSLQKIQKLADDRSHVCFQMWGQAWRSAYIHGRHRHGQLGNSASCGNIACVTWTCLAEAPPCQHALSI